MKVEVLGTAVINSDFDKLRKDLPTENEISYHLRLVLVKNDTKWFIYFADIMASKRDINVNNQILLDSETIVIARLNYQEVEVENLLYNLINKNEAFYLTGSGKICTLPIFSKAQVNTLSFYNTYTQFGKSRGLPFPVKERRVFLLNMIPNDINEKIPHDYLSLNEAIKEKLGIDLDRYNGLVNYLSIYIEEDEGKIDFVVVKDHFIKIDTYFIESLKKDYKMLIWLDGIKKELSLEKEIRLETAKRPSNARVRLLFKNSIIDEYNTSQDNFYEEQSITPDMDYNKIAAEIQSLKDSVEEYKFELNGKFNFKKIEDRLEEAQAKTDPRDVIQSLGEALEYTCAEFCNIFGVRINNKTGLGLHDKVVQYWKDKIGIAWEDIKHQTGARHVIRLSSLKKHHNYTPYELEAKYSVLLTWRGFSEIVEMTNRLLSRPG